MIALWMLYATAVAAVTGVAAALVERATFGTWRQRRWIWLVALVMAIAIPAWAAAARGGSQPRAALVAGEKSEAHPPTPGTVASELGGRFAELMAQADARALARYDAPLAVAWVATVLLALATFGVVNWTLVVRRRAWCAVNVDGEDVLLSPAVGPAVVGAIRPRIVVPEWSLALPPEQRALMLEHERQHIRSRDPLVLHTAALLTLVMPWNIVAWWITRRLQLAVEVDCDARVLATGRDAREYGTLLLDVCARRARGGPVLAPALFAQTSSLTRRILAMHPGRSRFPRARVALGAAAALAAVVVACEMPSPTMLAPDGRDVASTRLYGQTSPSTPADRADLRELVAKHFPEVARGEGGPAILYVVASPGAGVVLTDVQAGDAFVRMPARASSGDAHATAAVASGDGGTPSRAPADAVAREEDVVILEAERKPRAASPTRMKTRAGEGNIPAGIAALRPDDIESIDVSKHAAGTLAPKPVSIIFIVLKPNAHVPSLRRSR